MRIDADRLHASLDALARIGAIPGGGVCRLAFSEEDRAGRDYVEAQMHALGLSVSIDAIGNILGIRAGRREGPIVLTGSHTDTVGTGGRFDGSLGVLAGLEAVATLNDNHVKTELPIGVLSFVNEEGVRFMPDMLGSLYLTQRITLDEVLAIRGVDGTTIGENMDALDYAGTADFGSLPIARFVELHIEQGPVLEREGLTIGVVDQVQGIRWLEVTFKGAANHAGVTPMHLRHDAGYAAGALAHRVRLLAGEMGEPQRATTGAITLAPNLINVIAEQAVVTVDLRNPELAALDVAEERVRGIAAEIADAEGLQLAVKKLAHVDPVDFDAGCISAVEASASALGYPCRRMLSGAGHDAQIMASRFPASMIFVPSQQGISHNVSEYTTPADVEAGANVLLHTLLKLANPD